MRLTTISALGLAFVASSSAMASAKSDLDGSVWAGLEGIDARSAPDPISNRPAKRQTGWSPPASLVTPLKQVWDHCVSTYSNFWGFKNYGWDQIIATKGSINVCVRWESTASVTEAQRAQIATVVNAQYQKWFQWLYGYDNFPYSNVQVNVVGWAVRSASLLQGSTSGIDVYTNLDSAGAPQCSEACGRFFHQTGDYSSCPGGAARHYDQSLWLTDGFEGGAGGDWGQRIGREYFMGALSTANIHILLHEMGHTFGLDDFYDWVPTGVTNFVMLAGSATYITDFDGWMLRNWWYELSRYRGWQSLATATTSRTTTTTTASRTTTTAQVTTTTSRATTTTTRASTTTTASAGTGTGVAQRWGQCGGSGWTGPTACVSPYVCTYSNDWYSQCL